MTIGSNEKMKDRVEKNLNSLNHRYSSFLD